jgi:hypothetical protein
MFSPPAAGRWNNPIRVAATTVVPPGSITIL